jgi:hypothetical protein
VHRLARNLEDLGAVAAFEKQRRHVNLSKAIGIEGVLSARATRSSCSSRAGYGRAARPSVETITRKPSHFTSKLQPRLVGNGQGRVSLGSGRRARTAADRTAQR